MGCPPVALVLLLLMGGTARTGAAPSALPGHSIANPPDINLLAKMWQLTGTAMPSHSSLILTPGVADRVGTIFSRSALKTNDFEAQFTISAKPGISSFRGDGFAFWYSEENASDLLSAASTKHSHNQDELIAGTWYNHYVKLDLGEVGYKTHYKGLGVFFVKDEQGQSLLRVHYGDGEKTAGQQTALDIRNGEDHSVKIRVTPDSVTVTVESRGETRATVSSAMTLKSGGFIGFSCFGGTKESYNPKERSAFVEIKGLQVLNHAAGPGEDEMPSIAPAAPQGEKEDVLGAHSSFKEHRDESEAIKDLTNMIFKLVIESKPQREQMKASITALSKRVATVEETFRNLKAEIDKKTGHNLGAEFDAIKKELADMHATAHRDTDRRGKKLADLHSDIEHVHKTASSGGDISGDLDSLSKSNEQVLDQLTNQHQRMFGVSIFAIAFIIIAGLSLYNKFRCWEKKHVL